MVRIPGRLYINNLFLEEKTVPSMTTASTATMPGFPHNYESGIAPRVPLIPRLWGLQNWTKYAVSDMFGDIKN